MSATLEFSGKMSGGGGHKKVSIDTSRCSESQKIALLYYSKCRYHGILGKLGWKVCKDMGKCRVGR